MSQVETALDKIIGLANWLNISLSISNRMSTESSIVILSWVYLSALSANKFSCNLETPTGDKLTHRTRDKGHRRQDTGHMTFDRGLRAQSFKSQAQFCCCPKLLHGRKPQTVNQKII